MTTKSKSVAKIASYTWGLLGPEMISSERRTRTLRLGSTVRFFNDRAVPGLGGVWFAKQLLLALLGVAVAERLRDSGKRSQNIETANSVEALACWLALHSNRWTSDSRLRGALKLRDKKDLSFVTVRKQNFYVTQPMRQATVQPLRALGVVDSSGERFSAFRCTPEGEAFIEAACAGFKPHQRSVLDYLVMWAKGDRTDVTTSAALTQALSPLVTMSKGAREFLRERIVQGNSVEASRRRKALDWVGDLRDNPQQNTEWNEKPEMLDELHWRDMRAGAIFFAARDAAIRLLDEIELLLGNVSDQRMTIDAKLPETVADKVEALRKHAHTFLGQNYDPSPGGQATVFCRECNEQSSERLLETLLLREGHVLQLRGKDVVPGIAFRGSQVSQPRMARSAEEEGAEVEITQDVTLPDGISHRIRNLFLLNLDLRGELSVWLNGPADDRGGVS